MKWFQKSQKLKNSDHSSFQGQTFFGQLLVLSPKMLKSQIPTSSGGKGGGGGVGSQLSKSTSNFLSPVLSWKFHSRGMGWGGGGGVVPNGMHGIWWGIWGELQNFDKKMCNAVWVSASQIVSLRKLKRDSTILLPALDLHRTRKSCCMNAGGIPSTLYICSSVVEWITPGPVGGGTPVHLASVASRQDLDRGPPPPDRTWKTGGSNFYASLGTKIYWISWVIWENSANVKSTLHLES